jgi:hypothetical protein
MQHTNYQKDGEGMKRFAMLMASLAVATGACSFATTAKAYQHKQNAFQQCYYETSADSQARGWPPQYPFDGTQTDFHRYAGNDTASRIAYVNGPGGAIFYDCRYTGDDYAYGGLSYSFGMRWASGIGSAYDPYYRYFNHAYYDGCC